MNGSQAITRNGEFVPQTVIGIIDRRSTAASVGHVLGSWGSAMVFPLYDDNPFKRARIPYVTWGLIVLNVGIFLFEIGATDDAVKVLLASFGATPSAITHQSPTAGWPPPELTLISYMFLHGGWEHILGNMIYLWV